MCFKVLETTGLGKGKAIAIQTWRGPSGSRRLRLPEFLENRYVKLSRLSALAPAAFTQQEIRLVLISVRDRVDISATVRPGRLSI